jgi:hypothetical protein
MTTTTEPTERRLAHHVVPPPQAGPTIVRDMAAYHAARAWGFYLTATDPTNPRHVEATQMMLAEFQLAVVWNELMLVELGASDVDAAHLARTIIEDIASPQVLDQEIRLLLASVDVNPRDIAPYMAEASSR